VRYLRTLPEADALIDHVHSAANVVVIGAGWIGLETAAAARTHGTTVTIVELDSMPLHQVLGDEVGPVFASLHRANGVAFRFGTGVREFRGLGGQLRSVVLSDGTEVPADVAVVAIGIEPATELAVTAGLTVDNGIVTDAGLRTSDPDIYACGDVANTDHPLLGRRIRVEHWSNALNGGRAAALALLGQPLTDEHYQLPYFFSDQYDLGMEYSGFAPRGGYDQVVFRGDPTIYQDASPEFVAFWVNDGRVVAGMNVNVWDIQDEIQALVRAGFAGKAVDLARLADPATPLADLVS
jgi:3-phenylpropionate/trans-cinnamate dioxygenase ferredoxin reductase subunit